MQRLAMGDACSMSHGNPAFLPAFITWALVCPAECLLRVRCCQRSVGGSEAERAPPAPWRLLSCSMHYEKKITRDKNSTR